MVKDIRNKIKIQEKSRMNLNLHPPTSVKMIEIGLAVMAIAALAVVGALKPCTVAFTVFLSALGFFACASPAWYNSRNAIKVVRMSEVDQLFGVVNFLNVLFVVLACDADTTRVTGFSFSETFAIQFEAVDLRAFTALLLQGLSGGQVQLLNCFEDLAALLDPSEVERR